MLKISFKPSFIREVNKLDRNLAEELFDKIELFKSIENHTKLKVHKLHGRLSGCCSFSVNYKTRIVFEYESRDSVILLDIGDHDLYK